MNEEPQQEPKKFVSPAREDLLKILMNRYMNYIWDLSNQDLEKIIESGKLTYKEMIDERD